MAWTQQVIKALTAETLNIATQGVDVETALDKAIEDMHMQGILTQQDIDKHYPHDCLAIEQEVVRQRDVIWTSEGVA